jgi:HK97 family phage portal protein
MRVKSLFSRPSQRSWRVQGWQTSPLDVAVVMGMDPAELWRSQPHLRTVVDFVARNVAQLGLHSYDRVSDTDRRRVAAGPLASLLRRPNPDQTLYELVYALVADLALYDIAFWWVARSPSGEWMVRPIPAAWGPIGMGGTVFAPAEYLVQPPHSAEPMSIPADQMIVFHGWDPADPSQGSSKVHALKLILSEQIHAYTYREQVWRKGGRVSSVIKRPADAPEWSAKAKERFRREWQNQYSADGPGAGGTPILEDGMTLERTAFSAREDQFVDAATLSLTTVASVYQVNPTMVGVLDNANYSNVREFRRMLYGDSLGPWLTMIQDRLNSFLLPRLGEPESRYVEFNLAEKLRGSFEEQAAVLQASVGRPWMTADEARALQNMPALGGDAEELVTPLNVLIGGQANPRDSAPPPDPGSESRPRETGGVVLGKARTVRARPVRADTYERLYEERLAAFFSRQRDAVLAAYGSAKRGPVRVKQVPGWDGDTWTAELAELLLQLALSASTAVAHALLDQLGMGRDAYDADRTTAWLAKMSGGVAEGINGATLFELEAALADADRLDDTGQPVPPEARLAHVFDVILSQRAGEAAASLTTAVSGFGATEAVRQLGEDYGALAEKTWRTRSRNPRGSHRAMDGETVPVDEPFSNGAMWPADSVLAPDERAGCKCAVEISIQVP